MVSRPPTTTPAPTPATAQDRSAERLPTISGPQPQSESSTPGVQSAASNLAVQRTLRGDLAPPPDQQAALVIADRIYDALDRFFINEQQALSPLEKTSDAMRQSIQNRFLMLPKNTRQESLCTFFRRRLSGEWLVKAYALLRYDNTNTQDTAMGLALIPVGTRDEEVFRILYEIPVTNRKHFENTYNETFGDTSHGGAEKIGTGSLKGDLKGDLSGWRLQKSLALLNRNLTSADELYFDSLAIVGTHTDRVISRIQDEWSKGIANFALFEGDWDFYVRNQGHWTEETWTKLSLYDAMYDQLATWNKESWQLVSAVLDVYTIYKAGIRPEVDKKLPDSKLLEEGKKVTGAQILQYEQQRGSLPETEASYHTRQDRLEEMELKVAEASLVAATTGGRTGLGTNNPQVFKAVETIRRVWERRIKRVTELASKTQKPEDIEQQKTYDKAWQQRKKDLLAFIPSEMDPNTPEYLRVKLLLSGDLNLADEVYLSHFPLYDEDKTIALVTEDWALGKMEQLRQEAAEPKKDKHNPSEIIRPTFELLFVVPVSSGLPFKRVDTITDKRFNDAARGAARLKLELDEGDSDSDLQKAYQLLKPADIPLRLDVIQQYATDNLSKETGDNAVDKFLNYISRVYEDSNAVWLFRDLLKPTNDPTELARRAQGRYDAAHSGLYDKALKLQNQLGLFTLPDYMQIYGTISGEETEKVAQESIARLNFIAQNYKAQPSEVEALMAIVGAKSPEDLAKAEYNTFQERLDDLRTTKRAIVEGIIAVVQLAADVALTIVTGGAAGPLLIASLATAIGGMVAQEVFLGKDYNLISKDNAKQLAMIIASAGVGAFTSSVSAKLISPERIKQLTRAQLFLKEATTEGVNQIATHTIAASFEGKIPTADDIAASTISILGASLGAGKRGLIQRSVGEHTPDITRLRTNVTAHVAQNIISGLADESGGLIRSGIGNLSWGEIATKYGQRSLTDFARGVSGGIGEFGAQKVQDARQKRIQEEQDKEDALDKMAEDPGRLPPDKKAATSARAAASNEPETISVVAVNEKHSLSAIRRSDGSITVTICSSPSCSEVHLLLEAARQSLANQPNHYLHNVVGEQLNELNQIKARLQLNAQDAQANERLKNLSTRVKSIMEEAGEEAFFKGTGQRFGGLAETLNEEKEKHVPPIFEEEPPRTTTKISDEENHHLATRYSKENKEIFDSVKLSIDNDLNLLKNFSPHGELRGWYQKTGEWTFAFRRGHNKDYNAWVTEHLKRAQQPDLGSTQNLERITVVLRKIDAIVRKHPDILAYGPAIFLNKPQELLGLDFDFEAWSKEK
jgi:hypothetical protein